MPSVSRESCKATGELEENSMGKWLSKMFGRQTEMPDEVIQKKETIARLILNHQRRLQKLKEHQTNPGDNKPSPAVKIEIEDIEAEIEQLKATMENESGESREKMEKALTARERRLEVLRKTEVSQTKGNYEQEIREIEAKIQELQIELEQLNN